MKRHRAVRYSLLALAASGALLIQPPLAMAADGRLAGDPEQTLPPQPEPLPPGPATSTAIPAAPQAQGEVAGILAQRIVPRYFDVTGVTAIPFESVAALLEPLAGYEITVGELAQRVNAITELYREHGYAISFALLQNQSFANGLVQVTVVEGYAAEFRLEGDPGMAESRLRALAEPVLADRPLRSATLERSLNLMRMVPGVSIRPDMALPQRADGATALVVEASHQPLSIEGGLSDLGLGYQGQVTIGANSLTPLGERTRLSATIPAGRADVEYYRGVVDVPLGNDGLLLTVDAYKYRSTPEDAFLASLGLKREIRNERAAAILSYPLLLNNERAVTASGGFYATRSIDRYTNVQTGASAVIHTDLRVVQAGLRYTENTGVQARSADVTVHRGLNGLGANQGSTSQYDLDFTRLTANASQTWVLPGNFTLGVSATGQHSRQALPNSERISFGAWRFGLGYPAGEIAGDSGWGAALEGSYIHLSSSPWIGRVQPYVRLDTARAYQNSAFESAANDRRLGSVAVGVRLADRRFYTFDINVARPVGAAPLNTGRREWRVNANYTLRYD